MFERAQGFFYKHVIKTRNWAEMAWFLVYPLVALFTAGFFLQFVKGDPTAVVYLLVGTFMWNFYMLCQKGITYGVLYDVWDRCFKHSVISPASVFDFVLGNGAFGLVSALASMIVANFFAIIFFNFNLFDAGLVLVGAFTVIFFYGVAEGLVIDALIVTRGHEYISLTWILTGLIITLSGVYYPVEQLPQIVQPISFLLPTTHAIAATRNAFLGGDVIGPLLTGLALAIVFLVSSMAIYAFALKKSTESGLLSRL